MKKSIVSVIAVVLLAACGDSNPKVAGEASSATGARTDQKTPKTSYGQMPSRDEVLNDAQATDLYKSLSARDSLQTAFRAEVVSVCQAKGCWMRLKLPGEAEVMVRFKEYGFFVPKDLAGSQVRVEGLAFLSEVPEADRRHLAADAGASQEEINRIEGPLREYGFEATGVLIESP